MKKRLSEMTLEELWQLFPIILKAHQDCWKDWYEEEKRLHVHLHLSGDCNEVLFRDYLIVHPDEAKAYEALKLRLWKQYEHDRDGYTQAKTDFVNRIMSHVGKG